MQLCEWFPSTYFSTPKISIVLFFGFYCYFVFSFKSEIRKSETQSRFNNEFSLLNLIDCALYWAARAPSHKMGFRSLVSKSGLPGEGRHEGLVPRNDVLTNGFI